MFWLSPVDHRLLARNYAFWNWWKNMEIQTPLLFCGFFLVFRRQISTDISHQSFRYFATLNYACSAANFAFSLYQWVEMKLFPRWKVSIFRPVSSEIRHMLDRPQVVKYGPFWYGLPFFQSGYMWIHYVVAWIKLTQICLFWGIRFREIFISLS